MSPAVLEKKIADISPRFRGELADFVEYLLYKQKMSTVEAPLATPHKSLFGALRGSIPYIAPDFDEPLECFREYM